jgi:hypothetical protein
MSETIHRTPDWPHRQEIARSGDFFGARISIGSNGGGAAMAEHHSLKRLTLEDGFSAWTNEVREQAETMARAGTRRLLKKITQADEATKLYKWINSPELQPPK